MKKKIFYKGEIERRANEDPGVTEEPLQEPEPEIVYVRINFKNWVTPNCLGENSASSETRFSVFIAVKRPWGFCQYR